MYTFSKSFGNNLHKNTNIEPNEENLAYIKANCEVIVPHKKIDNKGRHSAYFTFSICNQLITVVADERKKLLVTAVIETHRRFYDNKANKFFQ